MLTPAAPDAAHHELTVQAHIKTQKSNLWDDKLAKKKANSKLQEKFVYHFRTLQAVSWHNVLIYMEITVAQRHHMKYSAKSLVMTDFFQLNSDIITYSYLTDG